jgi:hypothetical protein
MKSNGPKNFADSGCAENMWVWETEIQAETNDTSAVAVALNITTKLGTRDQKRATETP